MTSDTLFLERFTEETSQLGLVLRMIEVYPNNPVSIAWKQMVDEGADRIDLYYEVIDEADDLSMADIYELKEIGFDA